MKTGFVKTWRDAATLIMLSKRSRAPGNQDRCNYDVLLQTRTQKATFKNAVVFPGGVTEAADSNPAWIELLGTFGYSQHDFNALHRADAFITPILQDNPVQRHISLRITAIRETFEELGLLICSREHKKDRNGVWASFIPDIDVKHWQNLVVKNPEELLHLCRELNCYPDIWALNYWSNWLSPVWIPKRFDTAFFITAFENKPTGIEGSTEVTKVQWLSPDKILEQSRDPSVVLYPPQAYELQRLTNWTDIEELSKFAKEHSSTGTSLVYHASVQAKDGNLHVLPGDDLYPTDIDLNNLPISESDKTILELRESSKKLNRYEYKDSQTYLIIKNMKNMADQVVQVHTTI